MTAHTVAQGDCIYSIAEQYGLLWTTIWNHPENAELKQKRKNPNVLLAGDVVMIPDKTVKRESRGTDATHKFKVKTIPAQLRLQMLDRNHKPRSGLGYTISIDGSLRRGTTDGQGRIHETMPPDAKKATLCLLVGDQTEKYDIDLGHVNPIEDSTGGQQRMTNLGLGQLKPKTALLWFQKKYGLAESGELDSQTLAKLKSIHGC